MLEPYAVKVASTVLRRGGGSNLSPLFDYAFSKRIAFSLRYFMEYSYQIFFLFQETPITHVPQKIQRQSESFIS
jgi:hypothetical protein